MKFQVTASSIWSFEYDEIIRKLCIAKEKEDKIDIESLTDEEWAKYLGL